MEKSKFSRNDKTYGTTFAKSIQQGGTWLCFKQYKLMHNHSIKSAFISTLNIHKSVGLS